MFLSCKAYFTLILSIWVGTISRRAATGRAGGAGGTICAAGESDRVGQVAVLSAARCLAARYCLRDLAIKGADE